ncbi:MAG: epoxyqueuosine reductase QueH [Spirochaetaceae bacterium]|jgi:predicted adenine nucleotide alpha hydrolase (AANH) superfamily ATPase|nr:epoxyqueuosine reductase QueH [Spirochaetaceae bacterium]
MMKILFHVCCAPCSVACITSLREEGMEISLYWYNPNIHPYTEYKNRRDCLSEYAKTLNLPLVMEDQYGLRPFLTGLDAGDLRNLTPDRRCAFCYRLRLEETARTAREKGFDGFSTSLLISPYQAHALIGEIAQALADRYGIEFLYRDFRPLFREGQAKARAAGLYMQKYCGCIFSEEERYIRRMRP